jgi:hypothetical protein
MDILIVCDSGGRFQEIKNAKGYAKILERTGKDLRFSRTNLYLVATEVWSQDR